MTGAAGRRGNVRDTEWGGEDPYDDNDAAEIDETPAHLIPIVDIEEWSDYWSEELAIVYHVLREQTDAMGLPMLEKATFNDFVEFVYNSSSKYPPR